MNNDLLGQINLKVPDLGELTANFVVVAFFAAGIFFVAQIVIGGISWINAGGDPKALESARSRITNAVIGLIIVVAAFAIAVIFTQAFGIDIFTKSITIGE